jgi:hypothetical protein
LHKDTGLRPELAVDTITVHSTAQPGLASLPPRIANTLTPWAR